MAVVRTSVVLFHMQVAALNSIVSLAEFMAVAECLRRFEEA
jgi:hypothetical protein